MATPRPIRSMDPYAQAFWAYTQKKEFRLQQCSECHKFRWPPGPSCDHCLSDQCEWALMKGRGKVLSWTTFHRAYFPEYPAPHTSIVLELDEGPLFVSYPVGIDAATTARGHGAHAPMDRRRGYNSVNIICPCSGPWPRSNQWCYKPRHDIRVRPLKWSGKKRVPIIKRPPMGCQNHRMLPVSCLISMWVASGVDETSNKIARKGKGAVPGNPHAILGLLLGRRADAERKAPTECGLGGHGLLRHVNGMPPERLPLLFVPSRAAARTASTVARVVPPARPHRTPNLSCATVCSLLPRSAVANPTADLIQQVAQC